MKSSDTEQKKEQGEVGGSVERIKAGSLIAGGSGVGEASGEQEEEVDEAMAELARKKGAKIK